MIEKSKERIFRLTLSALLSSSMTSKELRKLVELLEQDFEFQHELYSSLAGIPAFGADHRRFESEDLVPEPGGSDGLLDLVMEILKRRRVPKRDLLDLLGALNPSLSFDTPSELTVREMVSEFLSISSTRARKSLLRELGLNVEDDLYLGGISNRNMGGK